MTGFEPAAPCSRSRCATRLRYIPTNRFYSRSEEFCQGERGRCGSGMSCPRRAPGLPSGLTTSPSRSRFDSPAAFHEQLPASPRNPSDGSPAAFLVICLPDRLEIVKSCPHWLPPIWEDHRDINCCKRILKGVKSLLRCILYANPNITAGILILRVYFE
jgi:hypothetical protein